MIPEVPVMGVVSIFRLMTRPRRQLLRVPVPVRITENSTGRLCVRMHVPLSKKCSKGALISIGLANPTMTTKHDCFILFTASSVFQALCLSY